jgi:hypothetical protein
MATKKKTTTRWKKPENYEEIVRHAYKMEDETGELDYSQTFNKFPEAFKSCDDKEKLRRLKSMMVKLKDNFAYTQELNEELRIDEKNIDKEVTKKLLAGRRQILPECIMTKLVGIIQAILKQKNVAINLDMIKNILVYLVYNYDLENLYLNLPKELGGNGLVRNAFDSSFIKRFINNRLDLTARQKTQCLSTAECGFHFPIDINKLKEERLKRLTEIGSNKLVPSVIIEQLLETNILDRPEYDDICVVYPHNPHNVVVTPSEQTAGPQTIDPDEEMDLCYPVNLLNYLQYQRVDDHFGGIEDVRIALRVEMVPTHGFVNQSKAIRNEERRIKRRKTGEIVLLMCFLISINVELQYAIGKLQNNSREIIGDGSPVSVIMKDNSSTDINMITPQVTNINKLPMTSSNSTRSHLKRACS